MWELEPKEDWALKNWCFWIVILEKTPESSLDCKKIKSVNPKGNQPWILIAWTDPEGEGPILWPPDVKSLLTGKDPDAGKCWRQEENVMTQDEMVGWHRRLNGQEFEQTPGDSEGQGSLACCSPWGCKKSNTTERLNNNRLAQEKIARKYSNLVIKIFKSLYKPKLYPSEHTDPLARSSR